MQKVKAIVICKRQVVRGGIASVLNSAENLEILGREGSDVLREAFRLQPDLIVYEVDSSDEEEHEFLQKIRNLCAWTKIVVFASCPLRTETFKKHLELCDGYLQGPLLPGFLIKAVELACYSGLFFFLGSSRDIKPEMRAEALKTPPVKVISDQYDK